MASGGVRDNLRNQLAVAVRSIQWSYAIFWSIASTQPGVLEWGDGYYNGDIKTRKTVQAEEFNADQIGLQRSEQLRELFESLSAGESGPQARRPSAALSPEDLTNTEWYYLVCMSFVFNIGQGLPGRTLAKVQPIWLSNAHCADSKSFSRSLLAKSASIQTVVCFPFMGGVIELGITELVMEEPGLIQHIKASFLEIPYPIVSKVNARNEKHLVGFEEVEVCSPHSSSNRIVLNDQQAEDRSQKRSWQFKVDDEVSNCVHDSMSSSDCISQTEKISAIPMKEKENDRCLPELREDNLMKLTSLGVQADEVHYLRVLTNLFKGSHQLILGPSFQKCNKESSFISWKKGGFVGTKMPRIGTPQRLLKKVLVLDSWVDNDRRHRLWRSKIDDMDSKKHVLTERRLREKINKRFSIIGSVVPSTDKVDQVSILENKIEHLKELKRRVKKLKSCREVTEVEEARKISKPQDTVVRTSNNYGDNNNKNHLMNKRKACEIDEMEPEINQVRVKDSAADNVSVSVVEKDVVIEIGCPWREFLLLEIMDSTRQLQLDSHSVQSTNTDGILNLTIKSKVKGSTVASAETIRQALQRVVQKC